MKKRIQLKSQSKIIKKYFISLKTATRINIIKRILKMLLNNVIFIQLKIKAKEPNILTIKTSLSN